MSQLANFSPGSPRLLLNLEASKPKNPNRSFSTMLHHISIAVENPLNVAQALAEIWKGRYMLKFTKTICAAVLLISITCAGVARAENNAPQGVYSGGGYKVETGNGGRPEERR